MKVQHVTEQDFDALTQKPLVIFDFWAEWCGPCRAFGPVFEAAAARHPDTVFAKIDTEAEQGLAAAFNIRAIPTVAVMRDGIVVAIRPGMLPPSGVDALLAEARALDMDAVRDALARQRRAA